MRVIIKGGVWKNTEDEILKAAVMKYGKNNWSRVASLMNRKSAKQCKARWYEWLDPSIRKVEWSREEEEKLLHLAKLMPNQWRSIAPIVGRTAAQCLEHYEELLDRAQDGGAKAAGGSGEDDPRRLRPGEIDPTPENKPARPDPVDMDEDEKEMLSEARARLANTKGKKARRKAREKQLDEARHLAVLQKHRELKAAGVESKLLALSSRKKRKQIDYTAEVPFQRTAPAGFYDVSAEEQEGKRARLDPQRAGRDMLELEGREEHELKERAKKRENSRIKRLFKDNAPAAIMKIAQENDPAALRRRSALSLPAPQVSDAELEDIVKLGQRVGADAAAGLQQQRRGDLSMPPPTAPSSHSSSLVGHDYQAAILRPGAGAGAGSGSGASTGAGAGAGAGAGSQLSTRTPLQEDVLLQEARNHHALLRGAGPLVGSEELPELFEGTGFGGAQPRAARLATPNAVLAPTPGSARGLGGTSVGGSVGATPASSVRGGWGAGGAAPRDALGLNQPHGFDGNHQQYQQYQQQQQQSDAASVAGSVARSAVSGSSSLASTVYSREQRLALAASLKALPEPEFTYEVALPAAGPGAGAGAGGDGDEEEGGDGRTRQRWRRARGGRGRRQRQSCCPVAAQPWSAGCRAPPCRCLPPRTPSWRRGATAGLGRGPGLGLGAGRVRRRWRQRTSW